MLIGIEKYIKTLEEEKKSKFLKWAYKNSIVKWIGIIENGIRLFQI